MGDIRAGGGATIREAGNGNRWRQMDKGKKTRDHFRVLRAHST